MFDGTLGIWKGSKVTLDLQDDIKPYHAKAFPIPQIHMEILKMKYTDSITGSFKRVNHSQWAAPTFIIPTKNGTAHFISDLRELNK